MLEPTQEFAKAERRAVIARHYVSGVPVDEIADKVGMSKTQVYRDIRDVRDAWLKASIRDFDEMRNKQLTVLDAVETQAWDSWRKSLGQQVKTFTSARQNSGKNEDEKPRTVTQTSRQMTESAGDPRFLKIVMDCVDKRMKLLGLEAPLWMIHDHVTGKPDDSERDADHIAERAASARISAIIRERYISVSAVSVES